MYEEILVATDGSPTARRAVDHAVELAADFDAHLYVVYVVDATAYGFADARSDLVRDALTDEGEAAVESAVEAAEAAGVEAESVVVTGSPARDIVAYATDHGVDLLVVGTHGHRGLDRLLLGSVAERVVRTAPMPVLTVRGDGGDE